MRVKGLFCALHFFLNINAYYLAWHMGGIQYVFLFICLFLVMGIEPKAL
jgi:hypothetical protein